MPLRALALSLVVLVAPATASADREPTPEELAEARIHFERARGFEDAGQYERAADEYLSAYALYPDPEFFFNVGRVYRLADEPRRSLRFYRRYLELDPDGRGAEAARAEIESLREEIDEGAAESPGDEPDSEPDAPDRETQHDPSAPTPGPLDPSDPDAQVRTADTPSDGPNTMRIAGIATGSAGVVALGVSLYFGNRARNLSDDLSDFGSDGEDAWTQDMIDKYDDGKRANTTMLVLGGVGIAAVTAGTVLYVLSGDSGDSESRGVAISPTWNPGGAGISLGGSF